MKEVGRHREEFLRHQREEATREASFGKVRPIIQVPEYAGKRIVVVRNRIYWEDKDKWNFFSDFLFHYSKLKFGKEWLETQKAAPPDEQHPLYVWRQQAYEWQLRQKPQPDGTYAVVPNGPAAACNYFYYDLYTVDDNSLLDEDLLARLKHREQFQGALHELFVRATCLRAGFEIFPENEKDSSRRHVEFVAVHNATGQHVLVEAKSRHRAGVMGRPGEREEQPDIRFRRLINDAIAKDSSNPLAIFVDTNLPPRKAGLFYEPKQPPAESRWVGCAAESRLKTAAVSRANNLRRRSGVCPARGARLPLPAGGTRGGWPARAKVKPAESSPPERRRD